MEKDKIEKDIAKMEEVLNNPNIPGSTKSILRSAITKASIQLSSMQDQNQETSTEYISVPDDFLPFDFGEEMPTEGKPLPSTYDFGLADFNNDADPNSRAEQIIRSLEEIPLSALASKEAFDDYLDKGSLEWNMTYRFPANFYYRLLRLICQDLEFVYILERNPFVEDTIYDTPPNRFGEVQRVRSFTEIEDMETALVVEIVHFIEDFNHIKDEE